MTTTTREPADRGAWSSTTFVNSTNNAWAVNTDHGYVSEYDKDEPYGVICVR